VNDGEYDGFMLPVVDWPAPVFPQTTTQTTGVLPQGGVFAIFPIEAPVSLVYNVLADHAGMSSWIPKLARSTVIEAGNPCSKVDFGVPSPIGEVSYSLYRCADGKRIWWSKAEGDRFERISGCYELQSVPKGTLVRYWSEVVAAIPLGASTQAEIAKLGLSDLMEGLKAEVQRRAGSP
jgi:uncharacterized membrane protein